MGVIGADRMLVVAVPETAEIGRAIMADRLQRQFGQALLDFGPLDLEQARFGARPLAGIGARKAAQFGKFERGQVDFKLGHLALEEGVCEQRLVAVEFGARDRLHLFDAALRRRDAGDAGAFVREEELGAGPALILFIDALVDGDADILEEHLVHFMLAAERDDRAHGDAGRFHVDKEEADAFLLFRILVGADEEEAPVGILRHRRPGLLPVDDIFVAVPNRRGAQAGEIGARTGFRIALTPPILTRQDARQEARFLLGGAEGVDDRADHREAEGHQADAVGARGLLRPDETLRRRPAGAAIFDRPGGRDPSLFVENLVPGEEILLAELVALILLAAQFGGVIFGDERAHFLLEGEVFGAELHVHYRFSHWVMAPL